MTKKFVLCRGMKNRALRKAAALLLALFISASCLLIPAGAESVTEWNGISEMQPGKTYYISNLMRISKEVNVPAGATLRLRKGAALYIYSKGSLNVSGTLYIAGESTFKNSGTFMLAAGGVVKNYGEFLSSISAVLKIKGELRNFKQGTVKISSATYVYKTSLINNRGNFYLLNSSDATVSGKINNESCGSVYFQGLCVVTVSGRIDSYGYMAIGSIGRLKISGKVYIYDGSDYNRFGNITVTKSGTLTDSRMPFKHADMTVAAVVDEPDVFLKGIDVSYVQEDIDWAEVASTGIDFAIIRAARGTAGPSKPMKTDDYFVKNITEATANGINCGVYFYSYASTIEEVQEEARFLVDVIRPFDITYPVVLDMEEEMGADVPVTEMIEAFFEILMDNGYFPMFYSYKSWLERSLDMRILDKYAIWLAETEVDQPTYEGGYYIWQYDFEGRVKGIKGDVDLDYSYRDFAEILRRLGLNNLG